MEGINSTTDSQEECTGDNKEWKPNSCQSTGSNLSLSSTHSDNNHHYLPESEEHRIQLDQIQPLQQKQKRKVNRNDLTIFFIEYIIITYG